MLSLPGRDIPQLLGGCTGAGTSQEERARNKSRCPTGSQSRGPGPKHGERSPPDTGGEEAVGHHARGSDGIAGESDRTDTNREQTVLNQLISDRHVAVGLGEGPRGGQQHRETRPQKQAHVKLRSRDAEG